jgi:hypothetical protein
MEALGHARSLLRQRRDRDAAFPPGLFGEPAWDMLLSLYIARCELRLTTLTDLAASAGINVNAAERHLAALETAGLVQRQLGIEGIPRFQISNDGFGRLSMLLAIQPEALPN